MKGKIVYIHPNPKYGFNGAIVDENETKYLFNARNWYDRTVKLADIQVGMTVEFELRDPNTDNKVFPKNIRLPGTVVTAPPVRKINHSRGDFHALVFVQKEILFPAMEALVGGFDPAKIATAGNLYREIAVHYNSLSDSDFVEMGTGDSAILLIPTGFQSKAGKDIQLCCTKNADGEKSAWTCKNCTVTAKPMGSQCSAL